MLITYPDVVSGGFTVVRRDEDGVHALALRVRAQRRRPALLHDRLRPERADCPARAPSRTSTPTPSSAGVVNGVDPNPGDGYDENGSNIRGEQNIGRDGGPGRQPGRTEQLPGGGSRRSTTALAELIGGLLHANPFATLTG